jgi:hypothetical protein
MGMEFRMILSLTHPCDNLKLKCMYCYHANNHIETYLFYVLAKIEHFIITPKPCFACQNWQVIHFFLSHKVDVLKIK